ncbi:MAG: acetyl-CoA carboxylase biotin carboxyl carrier protein [Bdellovibrionales bacterium]|jgi:acetyl-CoA carboxylase biotin carboxyl carrier protein|nr:acetyl-CoA carboxylase biotin carboxyl carrier protein [Bdellovibrionales bacterium]
MNFERLKKFIDLAKETGATELKYDSGKEKYSVSFKQDIQHVEVNKQLDTPTKEKKVPGVHEIKSPFVGTFYRSSSPESDPYITVGKKIKEGKVLCIIEAMKIMNEIESEISGEIIEICVENENYVEFGQTLFKVKV